MIVLNQPDKVKVLYFEPECYCSPLNVRGCFLLSLNAQNNYLCIYSNRVITVVLVEQRLLMIIVYSICATDTHFLMHESSSLEIQKYS